MFFDSTGYHTNVWYFKNMWMITKYQGNQEQIERVLDLLLKVSPDLFLPEGVLKEEGFIFLQLSKVSHYWNLKDVEQPEHALNKLLQHLYIKEGLSFVIAPSASWAYFYFKISDKPSFLQNFSFEQCQKHCHELFLPIASHFLADHLLQTSGSARAEWNYFMESLESLGFLDLSLFLKFCQDPTHLSQITERLGLTPKLLYSRLCFREDFPLKMYLAQGQIQEHFYPDLENQIGSPAKLDILDRLKDILEEWEERLRLRKSLIKGFEVLLISNRGRFQKTLCLCLPRATRDAKILFRLLHEKWLSCTNNFADKELDLRAFVFEEVRIKSLGLQFESDRQMHLFDPKREDSNEEWSLLVGTLLSLGSEVRVGHYAAHPSYWPEFSVQWQSWSDSQPIDMVEDHPERPLLLYSPPRFFEAEKILSEEDFLKLLVKTNCLESLERVSDPWRGEERSYARIEQQWLYWDHKKQRAYVHGVFPETKGVA